MGSGKGQSRRVHSSANGSIEGNCASGMLYHSQGHVETIIRQVHAEHAWSDFIHGGGLGGVPLHEYYLEGRFGGAGPKYPARCEKVLAELFADAVAVGAIVLPSPYVSDNFVFKVSAAQTNAYMCLKDNPGKLSTDVLVTEIIAMPYLHDFTKMSSVGNLVSMMSKGIEELLLC